VVEGGHAADEPVIFHKRLILAAGELRTEIGVQHHRLVDRTDLYTTIVTAFLALS